MPWYALQCRPRKEDMVARQVESHGLTVFAPRLFVQPVNPRARTFKPYFPGYIFVRADLATVGVSYFQHLPHAVGLIRVGSEPADVPEDLIVAIHRHLEAINANGGELFHRLRPGDPVLITRGLFAGYEAIFDARIRDTDRVRVLLDLLGNRQVALELQVGQIRPAT
jgi:transcription antitermination factor NusG